MNPKDQDPNDLDQLKHLLRQAMPPLSRDQLEPRTDLWPQLRAGIESQRNQNRASIGIGIDRAPSLLRVPWFDYALAAIAAVALLLFPGIIPALLYHF